MRVFCIKDSTTGICHIVRTPYDDDARATRARDKAMFTIVNTDPELPFDPVVHIGYVNLAAREIQESDVPIDRYFRDAWDDVSGLIVVDMPKARVIQMYKIRQARDEELKKQDVEILQAMEKGDTVEQARIAALKQTLRDIPQTFDLTTARTPDELKALWPSQVPRN